MRITTEYYVDYVCDHPSGDDFYYILVRTRDNLILFSNPDFQSVIDYAEEIQGINSEDLCIL